MNVITRYPTAQDFLQTAEPLLEQRELENNMLLGTCNNVVDKTQNLPGNYFLSSANGLHPHVFSVKTFPKAVVAGTQNDADAVKHLVDFYNTHPVQLTGVIGECFYADAFAAHSSQAIRHQRTTFVQGLQSLKSVVHAEGSFQACNAQELDQLAQWSQQFLSSEQLLPRSDVEMTSFLKQQLANGHLFGWYHQDQLCSMAFIIRKTARTAVIGYVYTPPEMRGKGYAQSCMQGISQHILNAGYTQSGLLVYETNAAARKVYEKLGYKTVTTYRDIDFE